MPWLDVSRQLEHSSNRHMSPAGSEDVRMGSETEADRHFRWVDGGLVNRAKDLEFNRLENETPVFDNLLFLAVADIRIFHTFHSHFFPNQAAMCEITKLVHYYGGR